MYIYIYILAHFSIYLSIYLYNITALEVWGGEWGAPNSAVKVAARSQNIYNITLDNILARTIYLSTSISLYLYIVEESSTRRFLVEPVRRGVVE